MKGTVVGTLAMAGSVAAFLAPSLPRYTNPAQCRRGATSKVSMSSAADVVDKKAARRKILQSDSYNRVGFKDEKEDVSALMSDEFTSDIISEFKENKGSITRGDTTFKLAEYYGFCWGVERAVAMAFQARKHFPDQTMHITNELIHNPGVNEKLNEMGVNFVPVSDKGGKDLETINDGDVVILPAFGASLEEMQTLDDKNVQVVDTTCPWVSKVWNTVDKHTKAQFTSVIHGKWAHEETVATASFCNKYLVVKNMAEAEYVAAYIANGGGDKAEFMEKFKNAMSEGFDPDVDLVKVGLANQTTMYKRETRDIGKLFEKTLMEKYGPAEVGEHWMAFDTICDATQERQDAILELVEEEIDLMLVVGGWDSSNTQHLAEISANKGIPTYWVNKADCIKPDGSIAHVDPHSMEELRTENFLPAGKIVIGVTSGASTPDAYMEQAVENISMLKKLAAAA
ncbi:unnamed protein product [Ectocarpus sp. CCAP 1310/34]|nr:unnamed protein product [Ectocarpus sp. CCAP 1310/34]